MANRTSRIPSWDDIPRGGRMAGGAIASGDPSVDPDVLARKMAQNWLQGAPAPSPIPLVGASDAPLPLSPQGRPIAPGHGEFESIRIDEAVPVDPNPDEVAAPITLVPTSTINPDRPRTVAAGYDSHTRTLTVLFRQQGRADDGQPYNYYDVPPLQWANFKRARSKGRFIYTYLDSHDRGWAQASAVTDFAKAALVAISERQQQLGGLQPEHSPTSSRGFDESGYGSGHLGGTGRRRAAALDDATQSYWENR